MLAKLNAAPQQAETAPPTAPAHPEPDMTAEQAYAAWQQGVVEGKHGSAVKYAEHAAVLGHAQAAFELAEMYRTGSGKGMILSKPWPIKAYAYYQRAAALGHTQAQLALPAAKQAAEAKQTERDAREAASKEWLRKQAEEERKAKTEAEARQQAQDEQFNADVNANKAEDYATALACFTKVLRRLPYSPISCVGWLLMVRLGT